MSEPEPLLWNTLDEAAVWLAMKTGEEWSARRVLNRALQIQASQTPELSAVTLLCAAPPNDFVIAQRRESPASTPGEPEAIEVRVPWQPLSLLADHVKQLLVFGHANVSEAWGMVPDRPGTMHRGRIHPPLAVTLAMVGIVGPNLPLFADTPTSVAVATGAPGMSADDEMAAWFDAVPVAVLETMFPTRGQWAKWKERASDNGLKAARTERGRFNPYRAGMWFLTRGFPGWDQPHVFRVLANNLPARSQDKREILLLSAE